MRYEARAPLPTAGPGEDLVARALLQYRQEYSTGTDGFPTEFGDLTTLLGFESGDIASPITCASDYIVVTDGKLNARGCCTSPFTSCILKTECVPSGASCGPDCRSNTLIEKCTDDFFPSCYTERYTNGDVVQTDIGCADDKWERGALVSPTTSGTDDVPVLFKVFPTSPPEATDTEAISSYLSAFSASAPLLATEGMPEPGLVGSSGPSASSSKPVSTGVGSSGSETNSSAGAGATSEGGSGGGLSEGATIGIAVCAAFVGLGLIAAITFLLWRRKKSNPSVAYNGYNPGMGQQPPGHAAAGIPPEHNPYDQSRYSTYQQNFAKIDDDSLAMMRRFSDEGTVSMTVAGRTNDEYRPQAA